MGTVVAKPRVELDTSKAQRDATALEGRIRSLQSVALAGGVLAAYGVGMQAAL